MSEVLQKSVLVLNKLYQPIHVTSVRRALTMLYIGTVRAMDRSWKIYDFKTWCKIPIDPKDETIKTPSLIIKIPRIVVLKLYDKIPSVHIRLNRHNVYLRDQYECQYCGRKFKQEELNIDHVIPKSQGGITCWENVVCCCRECNLKKGGRTPEESNMRLIRPPKRPKWIPTFYGGDISTRYEEWKPFLKQILDKKEHNLIQGFEEPKSLLK
jgi:5-methylcytosine-specific restriction endonuclease McrA